MHSLPIKELRINVVFSIAVAYSSCMIDVRLFAINLCALLHHCSLACYHSCSLKTPYKVIDNDAWKTSLRMIAI